MRRVCGRVLGEALSEGQLDGLSGWNRAVVAIAPTTNIDDFNAKYTAKTLIKKKGRCCATNGEPFAHEQL